MAASRQSNNETGIISPGFKSAGEYYKPQVTAKAVCMERYNHPDDLSFHRMYARTAFEAIREDIFYIKQTLRNSYPTLYKDFVLCEPDTKIGYPGRQTTYKFHLLAFSKLLNTFKKKDKIPKEERASNYKADYIETIEKVIVECEKLKVEVQKYLMANKIRDTENLIPKLELIKNNLAFLKEDLTSSTSVEYGLQYTAYQGFKDVREKMWAENRALDSIKNNIRNELTRELIQAFNAIKEKAKKEVELLAEAAQKLSLSLNTNQDYFAMCDEIIKAVNWRGNVEEIIESYLLSGQETESDPMTKIKYDFINQVRSIVKAHKENLKSVNDCSTLSALKNYIIYPETPAIVDREGVLPKIQSNPIVLAALQQKLAHYIKEREKEKTKESNSFFYKNFTRFFTPFSADDKIGAATKMLSLLRNEKIDAFTSKELNALRDGKLGAIIGSYEKELPKSFTNQESEHRAKTMHQFRMMGR